MPSFNRITQYVTADITVHFTVDHVDCAHCPLLETYSRNQCRMTGEYIVDTRSMGCWCPLTINEEINERKK